MTATALLLSLLGTVPSGSLTAVRVEEGPVIDGVLDDHVWQLADRECCTLWQYGPDYGQPMTEDTEFYILYDDDNLYFGFQMIDADQENMMEALTPRDNYVTGEWMAVLLDTWNDGREATSSAGMLSGRAGLREHRGAGPRNSPFLSVASVSLRMSRIRYGLSTSSEYSAEPPRTAGTS